MTTPITKKNKIIMILATIFVFILIIIALYLISVVETEKGEEDIFVKNIIDGDTFQMNTGEIIRLLCVDTPEIDGEGYEEATKFLESLILYKNVRLEVSETLNQADKYGRLLRYVYVNNLGKEVFVNDLIINAGFSEIYKYGDEKEECSEKFG